MNAVGGSLLWSALQVSLFCLAGTVAYIAGRRGNRDCGAPLLFGVIITAAAITVASFSPWPRWWTWSDTLSGQRTPRASANINSPTTDRPSSSALPSANDGSTPPAPSQFELSISGFLSSFLGDVRDRLTGDSRGGLNDAQWHWPAWLAMAILGSAAIGAARMLIGWLALARLLRATRRVEDPALIALLNRLREQLRCRREIELREMTIAGCSPATVGWRRPVILLPADWRQWTSDTTLAILAHETAHVAHGDFATWLAAQLGVVVNFYNPLVHWLSLRLRLEQELAADARGATLAGGAKHYAAILARLALAQDDFRPLWAGRPFFPTRGTLMRRIEMLHHQPIGEPRSPSQTWRIVSLAMLIASGLAVSGLRGPIRVAQAEDTAVGSDSATNVVAVESPTTDSTRPTFDRSYLPANTIAVISFKPLKVTESTTLEPVLNPFPSSYGFAFAMTDNGVDEVKTIVLPAMRDITSSPLPKNSTEPAVMEIYRMRKPYERAKLRVRIFGEAPDGVTETTCLGHPCLRAQSDSGHLVNYVLVDNRTIVIVRQRDVPCLLAAGAAGHPSWYDQWQRMAESPLAFACDPTAMAEIEIEPADAGDRFILSCLKGATFLSGRVEWTSSELKSHVTAQCASAEKAQAMTQLARTGAAGLIAALTTAPQMFAPSAMPKEFQAIDVAGNLLGMLHELRVNQQDRAVRVEAKFASAFITQLADAAKALLARQGDEFKARLKADEATHVEKLGRLVKAFDAYRARHGHYPSAAVAGPDGKTLHSWRVELLPYLDEKSLFDEYKLDEPWDSEHNKPLIDKIPNIYSTSQWTGKGQAEYYVVTGRGTLFDDAGGRDSITDSPAETILVLQGRQHMPWTKPVDIETTIDHNVTRPFRFGEGFYAAFADGSVKFVSKETDAATVRALFTRAGGEEVKLR